MIKNIKNAFRFLKINSKLSMFKKNFNFFKIQHKPMSMDQVKPYLDNFNSEKTADKAINAYLESKEKSFPLINNVIKQFTLIKNTEYLAEIIRLCHDFIKNYKGNILLNEFVEFLFNASFILTERNEVNKLESLIYKQYNENIASFYYLTLLEAYVNFINRGIDLPDLRNFVLNYFENKISDLSFDDLNHFLTIFLYLRDEDARVLLPYVLSRISTNINSTETAENQKLTLIQFLPKILSIDHLNKNDFDTENIKEIIIKNINKSYEVELCVCILSNYSVYVEKDIKLLEKLVPYLYQNISSLGIGIMIETFFIILQYDLSNLKNYDAFSKLVNVLKTQIDKKEKKDLVLDNFYKESRYFMKIKNDLKKAYEEWRSKQNEDDTKVLDCSEIIEKSIALYPFAASEYTTELLDKIFENYSKFVK